MTRRSRIVTRSALAVVALVAFVGTGCRGSDRDAVALPDGARGDAPPTREAGEVCDVMVRDAVETEVGPLAGAPVAKLDGDVYTCRYRVAGGQLTLAVLDLDSVPRSRRYIDDRLGGSDVSEPLPGVGHGGYVRTDGATVVRKDEFVLTVDSTRLPADVNRQTVSLGLAVAVMGCW